MAVIVINPYQYIAPSGSGLVTNGLVLHLDAGDSNSYSGSGTTWTDLSGNGNNATLVNGPTYSSANGGSIVFNGSNNYATTGNELDPVADGLFADSNSSWSVTSWFNSDTVGLWGPITGKGGGLGASATYVTYRDGNNLKVRLRGGNINTVSSISANTWYEVTVTWDGSTSKSYLNGVFAKNLAVGSASKQPNTFKIGVTGTAVGNFFDGRISFTSVYNRALTASEVTQNFDVLKGRYIDPYAANVALLLHGDNLTDSSSHAHTLSNSGISINTSTKKYGTGSLYFSTSAYGTFSHDSSFNIGSGDYTIEAWVYPQNSSTRGIAHNHPSYQGGGFTFWISSSNKLVIQSFTNGSSTNNNMTSTTSVANGAWAHVAYSRSSGTGYLFVNGNLESTHTDSTNLTNNSAFYVGVAEAALYRGIGYIDDLRFTVGVGRYTASFVPPTTSLPL